MHRTIEITVPAEHTEHLIRELEQVESVIGLSVQRGCSIKPPGDILTIHTLNRGADQVMKLAQALKDHSPVSVVTTEVASISDVQHQDAIDNDVDEAIWEEMETGLRHQGRITINFLLLMALGGSIAAVGLVSDPSHQAIAFVASAIIAPGFEPLAKIPLGLMLGKWKVMWAGVQSALAGYACLILSASVSFWLIRWSGAATTGEFVRNPAVEHLVHPTTMEWLVSICGALAGIIMLLAYRRSTIAGPLIALVFVPAAAMMGMAATVGRLDLFWEGLQRLGLDVLLIVAAGIVLIYAKQRWVHRRSPMR